MNFRDIFWREKKLSLQMFSVGSQASTSFEKPVEGAEHTANDAGKYIQQSVKSFDKWITYHF